MPDKSEKTKAFYAKTGAQLLRRAVSRFPDAEDSVDAYNRLCADPHWELRPATTRSYLAAIIYTLEKEVEQNQLERQRALDGIEEIQRSLTERRGRPEPRTSRKKCLSLTLEHFALITSDLRRHAKDGHILCSVLNLLLAVNARLGLRPCEIPGARLEKRMLLVRNAKNSHGRATGPRRVISLERMPEQLLQATYIFLQKVEELVAEYGSMERLCRILAERLARICARLGLPRTSLYTLRHLAIATWKRAGLSAEEIAALAGHVSTRTAWSHYARGKHGWHPNNICVAAGQETIEYVKRHMKAKGRGLWPAWTPPAEWQCAADAPGLTM